MRLLRGLKTLGKVIASFVIAAALIGLCYGVAAIAAVLIPVLSFVAILSVVAYIIYMIFEEEDSSSDK